MQRQQRTRGWSAKLGVAPTATLSAAPSSSSGDSAGGNVKASTSTFIARDADATSKSVRADPLPRRSPSRRLNASRVKDTHGNTPDQSWGAEDGIPGPSRSPSSSFETISKNVAQAPIARQSARLSGKTRVVAEEPKEEPAGGARSISRTRPKPKPLYCPPKPEEPMYRAEKLKPIKYPPKSLHASAEAPDACEQSSKDMKDRRKVGKTAAESTEKPSIDSVLAVADSHGTSRAQDPHQRFGPGQRQLSASSIFAREGLDEIVCVPGVPETRKGIFLPPKTAAMPLCRPSNVNPAGTQQLKALMASSKAPLLDIQSQRTALGTKHYSRLVAELKTCPFCLKEMPRRPSKTLIDLMQPLLDQYHRGAETGVKKIAAVCRAHAEELETIPVGKRQGWPQSIDWLLLTERLEDENEPFRRHLEAIVVDPSMSIYMQKASKVRKESGVKASIFFQGALIDQAQAGYYGEQGRSLFHAIAVHWFVSSDAGASASTSLRGPDAVLKISPFTPLEFINFVLVPELVCLLIMEDHRCGGKGKGVRCQLRPQQLSFEEADEIKNASSSYGVAMFPSEEGSTSDHLFAPSRASSISLSQSQALSQTQSQPLPSTKQSKYTPKLPSSLPAGPKWAAGGKASGGTQRGEPSSTHPVHLGEARTPSRPRPKPRTYSGSNQSRNGIIGVTNVVDVDDDDDDISFWSRSYRQNHPAVDLDESSPSPQKKSRNEESRGPPWSSPVGGRGGTDLSLDTDSSQGGGSSSLPTSSFSS